MSQTQTPALRVQSEGDQIDYTPASAVYAGDIIVVNNIPLLSDLDIAANALGALSRDGVWRVPKVTGAIAQFDPVYWNPTGDPVTGTAGTGAATGTAAGNYLMGFAAAAAASGDANVLVIPTFGQRSIAPRLPVSAVAAAGSAQGDAAALVEGFNLVSGADDAKGVILPPAVAGKVVIVKSSVSNKILKVYPATGDAINALSANGAISLASGPTIAEFIAYDSTTWYTLPLLPS